MAFQTKTDYPPAHSIMIWDGECGFCNYWVRVWRKITGNKINDQPFQEAADHFPDLTEDIFKEAVYYLKTNGKLYSGAAAIFYSIYKADKFKWLWRGYQNSSVFARICEKAYYFISHHRPFFFKLTTFLFGKNPNKLRPYWIAWLGFILIMIFIFI